MIDLFIVLLAQSSGMLSHYELSTNRASRAYFSSSTLVQFQWCQSKKPACTSKTNPSHTRLWAHIQSAIFAHL